MNDVKWMTLKEIGAEWGLDYVEDTLRNWVRMGMPNNLEGKSLQEQYEKLGLERLAIAKCAVKMTRREANRLDLSAKMNQGIYFVPSNAKDIMRKKLGMPIITGEGMDDVVDFSGMAKPSPREVKAVVDAKRERVARRNLEKWLVMFILLAVCLGLLAFWEYLKYLG